MRLNIPAKGPRVKVGYRRKKEERGLHPSGVREVLVFNMNDLAKTKAEAESKSIAVRIGSTVGMRKRGEIEAKAGMLGLKVLNPRQ